MSVNTHRLSRTSTLIPHQSVLRSLDHITIMADNRLGFLLFGDQSLDTYGHIAGFYRQGNPSILAKAFLEQTGHALRKEVESLGRIERAKLPVFRTIQQLNERYRAQTLKHPGLDGALLCISQLSDYIE